MTNIIVTLTIPSENAAKALEGYLEIYPNNETIDDPEWTESEEVPVAPQIAKYTDKQWVTEKIRRNTVRDVRRGLQMKANKTAIVEVDDTLIT